MILSLIATSLITVLLKLTLAYLSTTPTHVKSRAIFALYEFIVLILSFAAGLLAGLKQFATAVTTLLVKFGRLDIESVFGDKGYRAYVSAMRLDHEHTMPALLFTVARLKAMKVGDIPREAVRHLRTLTVLCLHPQLQQQRVSSTSEEHDEQKVIEETLHLDKSDHPDEPITFSSKALSVIRERSGRCDMELAEFREAFRIMDKDEDDLVRSDVERRRQRER